MLDKINYRYITNTEIIELTETEVIILDELIKANGNNVSCDELLYKLFGEQALLHTTNYIVVTIHRLRKKLKKCLLVKTKNTKGYYVAQTKEVE